MSEQDTSETHGSSIQSVNGNHIQETPKSSNTLRFSLLFISIIISLLVAPFFLTNNIFNICVFFATFTTLIFALTDLIIYLSKEPPHPTIIHINSTEKRNKKTNKNPLSIVIKKVVHYTQQCRVAVSRVMGSIFRYKWHIKTFAVALSFPVSLTLTEHWKEVAGKITAILEFFTIDTKALEISILITALVILIAFFKNIIETFQKIMASLTSKYFVSTLAGLAIIGALSALLIPSYTSWFRDPGYTSAQQDNTKESPEKVQNTPTPTASPTGNKAAEVEQKSTSDLRLHLLYITGGIIAILGLIETNRKNSQDHIRQVHAARRERYIEAVDKLSSEQAPVRLGGVYALVGLADEWIEDDNLNRETRIKEGQVIINNLCSYIRSPFPLADKFTLFEKRALSVPPPMIRRKKKTYSPELLQKSKKDEITFKEEQEIRLTIIQEIQSRLSGGLDSTNKPTPGPWSKFTYDFSGNFFYPINLSNSYFEAPIKFSLSNFFESVNFSSTFFNDDADFVESSFRENTFFENSIFNADVRFQGAVFTKETDFSQATFKGSADFSKSIFNGRVLFLAATFCGYTTFPETTFSQDAQFTGITFHQEVDFSKSTFKELSIFIGAFFKGKTDFSNIIFAKNMIFSEATFAHEVSFYRATFARDANFCWAAFISGASFLEAAFTHDVHFLGATFAQEASFSGATFAQKLSFKDAFFKNCAPTFASGNLRARFSVHTAQEDYDFALHSNSESIPPGEAKLDGIKRQIPVGTVLFDPDSPKDQWGNYAVQSEPAK